MSGLAAVLLVLLVIAVALLAILGAAWSDAANRASRLSAVVRRLEAERAPTVPTASHPDMMLRADLDALAIGTSGLAPVDWPAIHGRADRARRIAVVLDESTRA